MKCQERLNQAMELIQKPNIESTRFSDVFFTRTTAPTSDRFLQNEVRNEEELEVYSLENLVVTVESFEEESGLSHLQISED